MMNLVCALNALDWVDAAGFAICCSAIDGSWPVGIRKLPPSRASMVYSVI